MLADTQSLRESEVTGMLWGAREAEEVAELQRLREVASDEVATMGHQLAELRSATACSSLDVGLAPQLEIEVAAAEASELRSRLAALREARSQPEAALEAESELAAYEAQLAKDATTRAVASREMLADTPSIRASEVAEMLWGPREAEEVAELQRLREVASDEVAAAEASELRSRLAALREARSQPEAALEAESQLAAFEAQLANDATTRAVASREMLA